MKGCIFSVRRSVAKRIVTSEIIREEDRLKVKVCAPATDGNANKAFIKALAAYFGVKERHITIVKGKKSREKRIRVGP